jgi:RNA polymerase sigma factor (sigma-70 family)
LRITDLGATVSDFLSLCLEGEESRTNPMTTGTKSEKENPNCVPEPLSEAYLLAAAKGGCSTSFDLLCAPHATRLLKTAFKVTRNREDAEDAVQNSMMRAFVSINEFRGSSSFSTWLTRIVINSALMIRRKNVTARRVYFDSEPEDTSHFNPEIEDPAPNPVQILVALERRRVLRTAISNLRPRVRAVLEVGHLREFSMKETAKVLNISVGAAKARLFHGRVALRKSRALRAILQSGAETAA